MDDKSNLGLSEIGTYEIRADTGKNNRYPGLGICKIPGWYFTGSHMGIRYGNMTQGPMWETNFYQCYGFFAKITFPIGKTKFHSKRSHLAT